MMMKSLVCLLPVVVMLLGCEKAEKVAVPAAAASSSSAGAQPPIKVAPIKPIQKTLVRMVEQPGQVAAFEVAPLFAKVTGYVQKLHVDLGDKVTGPKYDAAGSRPRRGKSCASWRFPN